MDRAEDLVKREMLSIILHENITDPVEKKKRSKKSKKRMQRGAAADDHFELFADNELKVTGGIFDLYTSYGLLGGWSVSGRGSASHC